MPVKPINQLSARTPALADVLAVADPFNGQTGKSTVQQAANAGLRLGTAVIETVTGTNYVPYTYAITPGFPTSRDGVLTPVNAAGVTVERYDLAYGGLVTLTQNNLVGVSGNYTPSAMASLTTLSNPLLSYVGSSYQPNTMASLTTLSTPLLAYVGGNYGPNTMDSITTLSTPLLTFVGGAYIPNFMASLTTLSAPLLAYAYSYQPNNMASLTTLSAPLLAYVGFNYGPNAMASLTTLSTPLLTFVGNLYQPNTMASLTTLSAPLLTFVGGDFQPRILASLATINFPALKSIGVDLARTFFGNGRIYLQSMAALTSVTFPAIEVIGSAQSISVSIINGTAALSTFTLGSTLRRVEGNVIMTSCALTQASVDGLLVRLAALNGTGVTTAYSSKTVTITGTSAAPSSTGLAAKATLVARGCTVTHN